MPELPEVETIRKDLKGKIVGKKITGVEVRKKSIIRGGALNFRRVLENNRFIDIDRKGKLLIFQLEMGGYMLVHLKMTGQLVYMTPPLVKGGRGGIIAGGHFTPDFKLLPGKHTHVIFSFAGNAKLYFNDIRRFGFLEITDSEGLAEIKDKFGIEPFTPDFTFANFKKALKNRRVAIKAALLNQNIIAGIGNIYADEILYAAGVRPDCGAGTLTEKELKSVFSAIKSILSKAIKHRGTTFSDYVDTSGRKGNFSRFLRVYGRGGEECLKCGRMLKKVKIAGRGTSFCEKCQK